VNSPWPVRTTAQTPTRCRCDNPPLTTLGKAGIVAVILAGALVLAAAGWAVGVDRTTALWIASLWAGTRLGSDL